MAYADGTILSYDKRVPTPAMAHIDYGLGVLRRGALDLVPDGATYDLADLPVTDLVRDDLTGDLYAATDFGVMKLASGSTSWAPAAAGMPAVEVPGLTIVPGSRVLYAATHGRGAWSLALGGAK